jgi:hypothetical protein
MLYFDLLSAYVTPESRATRRIVAANIVSNPGCSSCSIGRYQSRSKLSLVNSHL